MSPSLLYENNLWSQGNKFVAGLDEVGRGSFAGPVVAGCVVFPPLKDTVFKGVRIDDSKLLSAKQRIKANAWILKNSFAWAIGEASVREINEVGVGRASQIAFRRSLTSIEKKYKIKLDHLLVDAFYINHVKGLPKRIQTPIKKGDQLSFSIASASIIAKVYRDDIMIHLGEVPKNKLYKWGNNKGYGTQDHRTAIQEYGMCKHHRVDFVKTWMSKLT